MAVTGIGNGYNNAYENTYVSQKNEEVKRSETKETCLHRKEKQRMKQTAVCQITILILQRSMVVLRMEMSQFQVHI